MRKYEVIFIVRADMTDADIQKIADRYKTAAEEKGAVVAKAEKWEKRKLAYEIGNHKEGNYVILELEGDATVPAHLNRLLRINDEVIRHRIFSLEE